MRLIDADAMCDDLATVNPKYKTMVDWCIRVTKAQPTIDAEPIVRCKDCKHYLEDGWGYGNCGRPNVDYLRMSEHDYCSRGEKK